VTEQRFPANWYPDPDDGTGLRYWDGAQWTEHRATAPPPPTDASAAIASPSPVASTPTASETAPAASTPAPKKRRGYLTMLTLAAVTVLAIVVIAVTTSSSSKSSKSSGGSSGSGTSAEKSGLDHDAQVVQATVENVLVTLGLAKRHPTTANMNQLAQFAQQAQDSLNNVTHLMARDIDMSNTNQAKLYDALNGIKNSMGVLVAYTATPNPATLASFKKRYQPAASEWNRAVAGIYADTGKALPTIPTS
jgi:hypothetical protein